MTKRYAPIDLRNIKTYPIKTRKNKVKIEDFATSLPDETSFKSYIKSLPQIQAGKDFRSIVEAIISAYQKEKPVIFAIGGHVIKCGLSPLLIDLMKRDVVTSIATNGSGSIHDFEIALIGETSEDVAQSLGDGAFGMAEETGKLMNEALISGYEQGLGLGKALGLKLHDIRAPHREYSILAAGVEYDIPITVHVAIGTDIIHQHKYAKGAAIGETSYTDFRILTSVVSDLEEGGVFVNFGSAVILPEVFLKAFSIACNLGHSMNHITTANFDMIQHYRPSQNVINRPTLRHGHGYTIIGYHELMVPLLYRALLEELHGKN